MLRESWLASPFGEEFRNATKQLWRWMKRKIMKSCCSSVLPSNHGVSKCFCSSNLYHHHLLHCHQLQWREKTAVVFPYAFGMTAGISIWTLYKIALQNCTGQQYYHIKCNWPNLSFALLILMQDYYHDYHYHHHHHRFNCSWEHLSEIELNLPDSRSCITDWDQFQAALILQAFIDKELGGWANTFG